MDLVLVALASFRCTRATSPARTTPAMVMVPRRLAMGRIPAISSLPVTRPSTRATAPRRPRRSTERRSAHLGNGPVRNSTPPWTSLAPKTIFARPSPAVWRVIGVMEGSSLSGRRPDIGRRSPNWRPYRGPLRSPRRFLESHPTRSHGLRAERVRPCLERRATRASAWAEPVFVAA